MLVSRHAIRHSALLATLFVCCATAAVAAEADTKAAAPAVAKQEAAATLPDPVARVNDSAISAAELKRANKVMKSNQPAGSTISPEQQKELDKQALQQLISAELLYQAGRKLEFKELEKQVEDKFSQGKSRFANEQDFAKAIKELDMTEAELKDYTRRDLIISNFIEKTIIPKITVSEEDSKKFYDQNIDKFTRPESVRASHILVGTDEKMGADEKKAAREKAEKLLKEVKGGADFATVAKANSTCPSSQQGGDLGVFGKGQMVQPFEKAAFALKPGEISEVVETQFGFHIIKLTEKKPAEKVEFKEVKQRIDDFLKNQKVGAAVNEFLEGARKSAKIEVLLK